MPKPLLEKNLTARSIIRMTVSDYGVIEVWHVDPIDYHHPSLIAIWTGTGWVLKMSGIEWLWQNITRHLNPWMIQSMHTIRSLVVVD